MSQPVNDEQFFHLTLGPVQGFVAQARRTRDFWAGSFLLSWMAGVAMHAVTAQKGKINFPAPDNGFLNAMHGNTSQRLPQQGSLPNRFKAIEAKVEAGFEPEKVTDALQAAWVALAEHIWQQDLEAPLRAMGEAQYRTTRTIWERQLASFWEVSWVLTADEANARLLDRRKNWRNHWPAEEGGVTCMMMADQQELSGASGPDRKTLDAFWEPLRADMTTDLRKGEVLSALAFIKRRFARHFAHFEWTLPDEPSFSLKGWKLPVSVPSVMHLAAWPWLESMLKEAQTNDELLDAFSNQLARGHDLLGDPEHDSLLLGLTEAFKQAGLRPDQAGVDPSIFFSSVLENPQRFADSDVEDDRQRQKLLDGLAGLRQLGGKGEPAPFYTILLMDGDSLGSQLGEPAKQVPISDALNAFTKAVPGIVQSHHGFLVYAGGDDVLALLPVTTALTCAAALRQRYIGCFEEAASQAGQTIPASLSGAALFCHIKRPLVSVLMDAHQVLDDIAKDATGRDALAIRIWQPGGVHATWSMPWEKALDNNAVVIEQLAATLRQQDDARFTHGFLFRIKALGEQLGWLAEKDDTEAHNLLSQLVRAEMLHSGLELKETFNSQALDALIERLLKQARKTLRHLDAITGTATFTDRPELMGDTFKVLRFLAREGHIDRDR